MASTAPAEPTLIPTIRRKESVQARAPKKPPCKPSDQIKNRIVKINSEQIYSFASNFVKTSKYSLLSFLPIFSLEEFHYKKKIANLYFLVVAAAQCIPQITNTDQNPTTLIPLTFVVVVDAVFAIIEDRQRHKADNEANARPTEVYRPETKTFEEIPWNAVQVGDIVKVKNREQIPADLCILGVNELDPENPSGICYVETKSLDGETNLKIRQCVVDLVGMVEKDEDVGLVQGEVEMNHPDSHIESFRGVIKLKNMAMARAEDTTNASTPQEEQEETETVKAPLQIKNLLLRGCVLRNTQWVVGVVLNTGHDTKIVMSITEAPKKSSSLELRINTEIKRIVLFLLFICLWGAIGSTAWNSVWADKATYLQWEDLSAGEHVELFIIQFFYFMLLLSNFIPVSLYVSMSTVKFFQAIFMNQDIEMYHGKTDTPAMVRTFTLNEELGQITHVFSDKTGTLTENIMEFRKFSIGGVSYGRGITEIGKAALAQQGVQVPEEDLVAESLASRNKVAHVSFYDDNLYRDLEERPGCTPGQKPRIEAFFRVLAVCHTVIPEKIPDSDEIGLSASSPDDEALVCGAKYFGWDFRDRQDGSAMIYCAKTGEMERYELLEVLEFTSKRKRMSVIVRDPTQDPNDNLFLFSKGADTIMEGRLKKSFRKRGGLWQVTSEHMAKYATEGLRTLVICQKKIDEDYFQQWYEQYEDASTDLEQIELRQSGKPNEIERLMDEIEQDLDLLGCTAIEDKLQDDVGMTIAHLARAGIKIWVLTGDKEETAINIAVACQLILPSENFMRRIIINFDIIDSDDLEKIKDAISEKLQKEDEMLQNEIENAESQGEVLPRCLVIDGFSLRLAMEDDVKPLLLAFSQKCNAVIGCRVQPDQKKEMVALIKENVPGARTLSIGDGANDVAMIQEAHVGVGISGQEGLQAVNSSDYAIAQFRFLRQLLLVHGRWNYRRMSKMVCYIFYKNILMSLPMFWFSFAAAFGGQKFYIEIGIQFYNLLYTSLPIILVGIYDQDMSREFVLRYPHLYQDGINDCYFKVRIFWVWMLSAILEACMLAIMPLYAARNEWESFWEAGCTTFTAVVIIVNFKLFFHQYRWHYSHYGIWFLSIGIWLLFSWVNGRQLWWDYDSYFVYDILVTKPQYWFIVILISMIAIMRDLFWKGWNRWFNPKPHHIVEEIDSYHLPEPKEWEYDPLQYQGGVGMSDSLRSIATQESLHISMPQTIVGQTTDPALAQKLQQEGFNAFSNVEDSEDEGAYETPTNHNLMQRDRKISMPKFKFKERSGFAFSWDETSELAQAQLVRGGIQRKRSSRLSPERIFSKQSSDETKNSSAHSPFHLPNLLSRTPPKGRRRRVSKNAMEIHQILNMKRIRESVKRTISRSHGDSQSSNMVENV